MADELENLTMRLSQEMRTELREFRSDVERRFTDLMQRVDGNTLVSNLVAGVVYDQEQRITPREQDRA